MTDPGPTPSPGPTTPFAPASEGPYAQREQQITEILKQIYDPEIPMNIIDLGQDFRVPGEVGPFALRREVDRHVELHGEGMRSFPSLNGQGLPYPRDTDRAQAQPTAVGRHRMDVAHR